MNNNTSQSSWLVIVMDYHSGYSCHQQDMDKYILEGYLCSPESQADVR